MAKNVKTNAMRMLDRAKISYEAIEYEYDDSDLSGTTIAKNAGLNPDIVFKTLVAKGDKTGIIVMCIPVEKEVDLKKAASVSGNKKVEMLHVKDLLANTGYIRGGCSPVGMKKAFPTHFDELATLYDTIYVSGGQRGLQLVLNPMALADYVGASFADVTK